MVLNFVGTGTLTRFFLECLKDRCEIGYILSRSIDKARNLAEVYGGKAATIEKHPELNGVVFVIVPDRYIETVANHLNLGDAVLVHCSGFLSSEIFKKSGRASIHPNFSFSSLEKALEMKDQIVFGLEGDERGLAVVKKIAEEISGRYFVIPSEKKKAYHLAAVIASNFPVALAYLSKRIYTLLGLDEPELLIHTLMKGVADNIKKMRVECSLTGPVKRGDWQVVEEERREYEKIFGNTVLYDEIVKLLREVAESERREAQEDER
ncbi:conserved hypothetical protein [Thermotoga petrophila RKU-1]|jgi:predicted short-subunit dehydrogenase-like oxidoreductase (DUF2520 family)|uniref:DUF2520 domain-containing protein n=1 Tax=Thermotoga petrophila (strain ATCC BAA-488 / DSM 13995 / JCM 10881 / RKU-1) TaxID=390874 RepID=A5ILG7_THEP1|nr:Rossmann-like and DUF2520 domain-containing protein [Thermotoga petrophila]ABQ47040.1 conserved hypothetical protein [Thermotoga petrophila RKU-1]MBZ4661542.1 hypothetical protein [Thermotoga sp.]